MGYLCRKLLSDIRRLLFCNPYLFIGGKPHHFHETSERVVTSSSYDRADEALDRIKYEVNPFKGILREWHWTDIPPSVEFGNDSGAPLRPKAAKAGNYVHGVMHIHATQF